MSKTPPVRSLSIVPYFYIGTDAGNILTPYCVDLRKVGGRHNLLHANMLEHYMQISEDRDFVFSLQQSMSCFFFTHLHCYYQTQVFGRKKGLISLEDKCNLVLVKKTLPEIHDSLGFRIILFGKSPEELVKDCYHVMNKCIDFFITQGFTPTEAEKKSSISKFNPVKHPNVFVPEMSLLSDDNKIFVKDYILNPKDEGYQSLHVIFVDALGREFEVQIRSYLMDQYAESGPASHHHYKANRYKDDEVEKSAEPVEDENNSTAKEGFIKIDVSQIDINKIHSDAFIVTGDEKTPYYDKVGIFEPRVFFELSNI